MYAGSGAPRAALRRLLGMDVIEAIDMRASVVQVASCSKRLEHRLSNSSYEQLSTQPASDPCKCQQVPCSPQDCRTGYQGRL